MSTNKAFLGINLDLLENPKYKNLDSRAMMLYALYADRYSASMNNARLGNTAFVDDMGVFIRFTNELAAKVLHVSKQKITDFRKELSDLDLIKVVREGLKGYKIYVYPVQQTPNNVELLLPWKNHTITVQKITSDWTILSKIEFCKNLKLSSQNVDINVSRISESTCSSKNDTSLSHSSLSHVFLNNNDLDDNAHARKENEIQSNQLNKNPYHSLPEKIKSSFVDVFGFITKPMAIELHSLISQSNEDMVNYVIASSKGHKVTNAIAYIKAAITNALKRGDKCVQDMINYYENNVKPHSKTNNSNQHTRYMTKEEAETQAQKDMEDLKQTNPTLWKKVQNKIRQSELRKVSRPMIPIYKLGE
ncbi:replication initiator protein A [Limosilactobacillus reuteri]|uniref:replication initiator protein A n=1 Tax=Limosilactobacillus reuteri TaxID=1598 RepID=UPI001E45D2AF|nr:replication initiator protein A [Limosilactobacillus reuteri]MCC4466860.1 replication initiator protein A [Limosilactobacillus reuteri]MCC4472894.1 replication initiator protein A [Limosilactobacillus reuteri]